MSELQLTEKQGGTLLRVKARAGAKTDAIRGIHDGALRVTVTQVAEKGKANRAIINLIAKQLSIPRSHFQLTGGAASTDKTFLVTDIEPVELRERIDAILDQTA